MEHFCPSYETAISPSYGTPGGSNHTCSICGTPIQGQWPSYETPKNHCSIAGTPKKSLKLQYGPAMEHLRRVKSYVFHWWHTNLGSMAQLWNTQKSLFHSRNTIFWQTPAMETVKFLTKKLRKHLNFLILFYFHSHCHIYNLGS